MKTQGPLDPNVKEMLGVAKANNVTTVWDRYQSQKLNIGTSRW